MIVIPCCLFPFFSFTLLFFSLQQLLICRKYDSVNTLKVCLWLNICSSLNTFENSRGSHYLGVPGCACLFCLESSLFRESNGPLYNIYSRHQTDDDEIDSFGLFTIRSGLFSQSHSIKIEEREKKKKEEHRL